MKSMKSVARNGVLGAQVRAKQAGMTLIELLIVLGVGAGIIAGIFVASKSATEEQVAQQDAKEVAALVTNIKRVYGAAGYHNLTAAGLLAAGGLPAGMRVNSATGGFLTSNSTPIIFTASANPGLTYTVGYGNENTTSAQCMAVARAVVSNANSINTGATAPGATGAAPSGGSSVKATTGGAVDQAALVTGCSSVGTARVAAQFS